jgi:hypothetical protein
MRKQIFIEPPPEQVEETIDGLVWRGPRDLLDELKARSSRNRAAVDRARPALARLVEVMRGKSGQSYKLRGMLYSMWNGKPYSVLDCVGLDYELREDLGAVILAWGFGRGDWEFFYDAIKAAVTSAGLWDWFLDERFNIEELEAYVNDLRGERE